MKLPYLKLGSIDRIVLQVAKAKKTVNSITAACVAAMVLLFVSASEVAQVPEHISPNTDSDVPSADAPVVVARILDHEIYASDLIIEGEEEHLRKTMEPEDFERWQRTHRVSSLWSKVSTRALQRWADENGVVVPEQQVEELAQRMLDVRSQRGEQADERVAPDEKDKAMTTIFARAIVTDRTIARALYEKYGGRVAFGSLGGCTSVEGTEAVLQQLRENGQLIIFDELLSKQFWQWASEPHGDVVREGKEAAEQFDLLEAAPSEQ